MLMGLLGLLLDLWRPGAETKAGASSPGSKPKLQGRDIRLQSSLTPIQVVGLAL